MNFWPMRGSVSRSPRLAASSSSSMSAMPQRGVEHRDGLGAHAGQAQQLQHGGLVPREQLFAQRHGAGGDQVADVGGHAFADAGDGEQGLGVGVGRVSVRELRGLLLDGLGGAAVGAHAEGVGAVDLEQRGGFVQQAGEGDVVHRNAKVNERGRRCNRPELRNCMRRASLSFGAICDSA